MRYIFYFHNREIDERLWLQTAFYTSKEPITGYLDSHQPELFVGFSDRTVPLTYLAELHGAGRLTKCEIPYEIDPIQRVWISNVGDYWIARKDNPVLDVGRMRILLAVEHPANLVSKKDVVVSNRVLRFIPDMYVGDITGDPGRRFTELCTNIVEKLAKQNNAALAPVDISGLGANYWDLWGGALDPIYDFTSTPVFARPSLRHRDRDMIVFGESKTFTFFAADKNGNLSRSVLSDMERTTRCRIEESLDNIKGLQIGLFRESAVLDEICNAVIDHRPASTDRFYLASSILEMISWLGEKPAVRVVLCGHGTAVRMSRVTLDHMVKVFPGRVTNLPSDYLFSRIIRPKIGTNFEFRKALKVGFGCPPGDEIWMREIRGAFVEALEDLSRIEDAMAELKEALLRVGIDYLGPLGATQSPHNLRPNFSYPVGVDNDLRVEG